MTDDTEWGKRIKPLTDEEKQAISRIKGLESRPIMETDLSQLQADKTPLPADKAPSGSKNSNDVRRYPR